MRARANAIPEFETAAAVVQRLSVLLEAGVMPTSAWQHAATGIESPVATEVAAGAAQGEVGPQLVERLLAARTLAPPDEREAWSALAAAWGVASESGAPLAPTLRRFAEVLRSLTQGQREVEIALAGPVATSRIVLALPVIGLLLGVLLGFDTIQVLATTTVGWACLAIGALLVLVGIRWNRRLIGGARSIDATPGLSLELVAIAVSSGLASDRAARLVEECLAAAGLAPLSGAADSVLTFARAAGVPAVGLLRSEAEELRRVDRARGQRRAVELGTRLLLPLGVCILPAFIALGVVPIIVSIVAGTVTGTLSDAG